MAAAYLCLALTGSLVSGKPLQSIRKPGSATSRHERLARCFVNTRAPQLIHRLATESQLKAQHLQGQLEYLQRAPATRPQWQIQQQKRRIDKYHNRVLKEARKGPERLSQLKQVRRQLARDKGSLEALGKVLARRSIRQDLLARVLANRHVQPVLEDVLHRLAHADRIPGISSALHRMAQAGDEAGMRGAKFEIDVGPWLPRVSAVSTQMNGHECDAMLAPGPNGRRAVVAMHVMIGSKLGTADFERKFDRTVSGELKELATRTRQPDPRTGRPLDAVMVIGVPHGAKIPHTDWQLATDRLQTNLTVVLVDSKTNRQRTLFEGQPRATAFAPALGGNRVR